MVTLTFNQVCKLCVIVDHTHISFVFVSHSCKFVICDCDRVDMGTDSKYLAKTILSQKKTMDKKIASLLRDALFLSTSQTCDIPTYVYLSNF